MKTDLSALVAGLLFGMGLMLSGMTNPGEVLGFLDWSGVWSPDLIGVLGSAVLVSLIGFQFARRMDKPWFEAEFPALPRKSIDRPLLMGAMLFGVGWGLAGYCPGPALAGLALGNEEVLVFLGAMLCGGLLQQAWSRNRNDG
ncbi:MAG: YeeE/YedE family protein [Candidatus Accumulibacter necessarius]|jgi:uncharacterized membrane protein YedE/YeeE|uniref:YeeE/YedE family protein n=1 Tax=Candidatus Accumulibacter necessarius TaxID=2954386 RepID=UPI002FC39AE7